MDKCGLHRIPLTFSLCIYVRHANMYSHVCQYICVCMCMYHFITQNALIFECIVHICRDSFFQSAQPTVLKEWSKSTGKVSEYQFCQKHCTISQYMGITIINHSPVITIDSWHVHHSQSYFCDKNDIVMPTLYTFMTTPSKFHHRPR